MTLPTTGPLSLSDIQGEFGGANPISLSEYYGKDTVPTSGEISIGDFYGTSNLLVNYLIVAGGGGGGGGCFRYTDGGGGGAGGYVEANDVVFTAGTPSWLCVQGCLTASSDAFGDDA